MVHRETAALQLSRDPAVAISGKRQCDPLQRRAQLHLDRIAGRPRQPTIVTRATQTGHLTQCVHRWPLSFLGRLSEFFKQATSPLTTAGGR